MEEVLDVRVGERVKSSRSRRREGKRAANSRSFGSKCFESLFNEGIVTMRDLRVFRKE